MKILISAAKENTAFNKIEDHLSRLGYNLLNDRKQESKVDSKSDLKKLESNIKNAEIVIIDVTNQNFRTGYVISKALSDKKVVVALKKENVEKENDPLLTANKSKNLILLDYSEKDVTEIIEKAVNKAKKRLDTKFILIISPEIDRYLDWASAEKRMHKAQIVRSAVENIMKKDKEYKDYLGTSK